jgi:IS30 family transposase
MWTRFSEEDQKSIWDMREAGVPVKRIAKHLDRQNSSLRKFIADHGGRRPTDRQRSELRLSLAEREEVSRGLAAGLSIRTIAAGLNRSPSTVCREVKANGGRAKYRALQARPGGPTSGSSAQASQALPVPAAAFDGGTEARGSLVARADLGVVG